MSRHLNPYFHWCAGCWKWVCDCVHCVEPLNIKRQTVKDLQILSVGYDRIMVIAAGHVVSPGLNGRVKYCVLARSPKIAKRRESYGTTKISMLPCSHHQQICNREPLVFRIVVVIHRRCPVRSGDTFFIPLS
jgi:hypothetical protein